jgi:hypothetical protein
LLQAEAKADSSGPKAMMLAGVSEKRAELNKRCPLDKEISASK